MPLLKYSLCFSKLAQELNPKLALGVDIDGDLIHLANNHLRLAWSRTAPQRALDDVTDSGSIMTTNADREVAHIGPLFEDHSLGTWDYFPISLPRIHGFLPFASFYASPAVESASHNQDQDGSKLRFPHNVLFETSDWANKGVEEDSGQYDLVLG